MAEVAFVLPVVFGASSLISSSNNSKEDNVFTLQSFDPFSDYYKFDRQCNDLIDDLLMDPVHGSMGMKIPISENSFMPGEGLHKYYKGIVPEFYEIDENFVNLYKKVKTHNGVEIITYYCQVTPITKLIKNNALSYLLKKMYGSTNDKIRITSIDTSHGDPRIYVKNQIYRCPTLIQRTIANTLLNVYFSPTSNFNVKIFISGERGSQKTYMGKVIKKMLDNHVLSNGRISSTLVDNFNPKDIGVNIETLMLSKATHNNPLILVINEFDTIMDYVVDPNKQCFDPRLCHAKDKNCFNNFLDNIADTSYCMTICTSETSVGDLKNKHRDFNSFLRKGRFDYYVTMSIGDYEIMEVI